MESLFQLQENVFEWAVYIFVWIGFSAVVGLIGSFLVLRRKGIPAIATIVVGYVGTIVGWSVAAFVKKKVDGAGLGNTEGSTNLIEQCRLVLNPGVFCIALVGTVVLLIVFRMVLKQGAQANKPE